jgi:uncharacterized membrane protein (UPF0127 family)
MNRKFWSVMVAAVALGLLACAGPVGLGAALAQAPSTETGQQLENEPLTIVTKGGRRHQFTVEVADEPSEMAIGLMHRTEMAANHGMLFDFGTTRIVQMWMKNTPMSLDMLFIIEDGTIVRIAERTQPFSLAIISSQEPVSHVLEIKAGVSRLLGLKPGDRVEHRSFSRQ